MGIGIKTNIGILLFGSAPSFSWQSYWTHQSNFYELWKVTGSGTMTGLKRGDPLTITGSGLNAIYAVPDTAPYKTRDTDYVFHKSDGSVSTACDGNRLIGYDFSKVIVYYQDVSPYAIIGIGILDTGQSVNNKMRDDWHLSVWWDGTSSNHGYTKGNRSAQQSVWTPESMGVKYLSKPLGTEYAYIADNGGLDVGSVNNFTICGWVKGEDLAKAAAGSLFGKNIAGGVSGRYFFTYNATTGYIVFFVQATGQCTITSSVDITTGWHFILATITQESGYLDVDVFIDNVQVGTTQYAAGNCNALDNKYNFIIGGYNAGDGSSITAYGKADYSEVRVYHKKLTPTEQTTLFNKGDVAGYAARYKGIAYPLVDETGNFNLTGINLLSANILTTPTIP